jgi:nickel transport protein
VNKAVEAKIQPLMSRLETIHENTDRVGLREIIGGIGYILGIMGIIMYFKSRKKS